LSKEKRHLFAKIIIALADDNRDEICRLMKEAGYVFNLLCEIPNVALSLPFFVV